ncbi:MAG: NAD(P)(+) transhydrogenase (Re/Si-specific) subunit beta [Acidobacteria bacterium]|nr:MAG: NAD(P)(+) transhydrogenase (Re/Si-specific) subunit beta [Acidobacteriota bacterium]REK08387.1 MAG: NAD(P)(+) transhydrogenase (Re/Si-specific) subunit beta [Acidobacteriota bacterium]
MTELSSWAQIGYLVAAVLFILGLKGLSHPRTAVRGNLYGSTGMLLAVVVTLFDRAIIDLRMLAIGLAIGAVLGVLIALRVEMTSMPELVALFNGFGGIASVLVATASAIEAVGRGTATLQLNVAAAATVVIGAVTFTGSLIAFGKLRELITGRSISFPGLQALNVVLFGSCLVLGALTVIQPEQTLWLWILIALAGLLGVLVVIPVGGADMPVVIALLNSYSGLAAAATGFVLSNSLLIIAGSLVGASGLILTQIMCKAMNRSLMNVLLGKGQAAGGDTASADEVYAGKVKATSADEIAILLETAQRVVIVPGYGLAVAQAQHAVRDLTQTLERAGATVEFAIHPVAGRMPGHMNVLLAEAEIPYEQLKEMAEINPTFEQVDVAIVLGANDVVNPIARQDPTSPIAGMPILDVDKARTVVVIKRSLSPGFAGIPNPLFAADNALMFFADGKQAVIDINKAIQEAS